MKILALAAFCSALSAGEFSDKMKVGDDFLSFQILNSSSWLNTAKGITIEKKGTYVIEFFQSEGTRQMPDMSDLMEKYKDKFTFLAAIDGSLKEFMQTFTLGDKMPKYPIAFGDKFHQDYGLKLTPCAIIVEDRKVKWIGKMGKDLEDELAKMDEKLKLKR